MAESRSRNRVPATGIAIMAELYRAGDGRLSGWAFAPGDLSRRLVVEILGDGVMLAVVKAEAHVARLHGEGHGDGCYGFALALDPRLHVAEYEVVLANEARVIARCSAHTLRTDDACVAFSSGMVVWRGGLRLSGTVHNSGPALGDTPWLEVYEGSRRLDTVLRRHAPEACGRGCARFQFDLLLPVALADGAVHRLRIIDANGVELDGSPVSLLAHRQGFGGMAQLPGRLPPSAGALRRQTLDFLDRLIPASLPFEAYPAWSASLVDEDAVDDDRAVQAIGVVIIGRAGSEATLASLRRQQGALAIRAAILDVEPAGQGRFLLADWQAMRAGLGAAPALATVIIGAGTLLEPFACQAMARVFAGDDGHGRQADLCLADHELVAPDGRPVPVFGPVFDYERLLSQGYAAGLFAVRHPPEMAGDPGDALSILDLLLGALEVTCRASRRVAQIPRILASTPQREIGSATSELADAVRRHLERTGQAADIETGSGVLFPLVHLRRPRPEGEVAIIIPTRDRLDLLRPCLSSLRARTRHADYRIVLVDNGSSDPETLTFLREQECGGATVLRDDGPFNHSRLNNAAMREISAPFACFLNNDVEILARDWLGEMQSRFSRAQVGGVGARLIWPNGMLQHGGVVLGLNFAAGHAYDRCLAEEPGYADGILAARECGALTAACLLVRRVDFQGVGGFDEAAFPVAFNDVDLCLKLREMGKVLVWSPHARLLHRESASRASDQASTAGRARADKELAELRRRWAHRLVADDCYNPNLNLDAYAFTGLALPPRDRAVRFRPAEF